MIFFIETALRIIVTLLLSVFIATCIWAWGYLVSGVAFVRRRGSIKKDYWWMVVCIVIAIIIFINTFPEI